MVKGNRGLVTVEGQGEFVRKMGANFLTTLRDSGLITAAALVVFDEADTTARRSVVYYPRTFSQLPNVPISAQTETMAVFGATGFLSIFDVPEPPKV